MNLQDGQLVSPDKTAKDHSYRKPNDAGSITEAKDNEMMTTASDTQGVRLHKRRKTGSPQSNPATLPPTPNSENGPEDGLSSVRQVHTETRFPQRKKPGKEGPVLEPTSTDRLIAGIWRQLFSPVQLARVSPVSRSCPMAIESTGLMPSNFQISEPGVNIRTGVSGEVFRAVNILCMKYYNQSQSSRALEMIVQAYWIECYEARIAVIRLENPRYSSTEARMVALKEACAVLNWKEKDLRNRMYVQPKMENSTIKKLTQMTRAIWRGYKEIKDAGGWASLIFASTGVYRFCKYRTGFGDGFATRLRHLRSAFEVAADTLHPEWRDLLHVIGQGEPRRYHGHPHEWVTVPGGEAAVPLGSTYGHLDLPHGFQYRFIDDCILDPRVFGTDDPRVVTELDNTDTCQVCKERQSDVIEENQCSCFPSLFGAARSPAPVQVFHTASGKNNGVVARSVSLPSTAYDDHY